MEMWISHNRSKVDYSTVMYTLGIEFSTSLGFAFTLDPKKTLWDLKISLHNRNIHLRSCGQENGQMLDFLLWHN